MMGGGGGREGSNNIWGAYGRLMGAQGLKIWEALEQLRLMALLIPVV
jgi:hypothetical protein